MLVKPEHFFVRDVMGPPLDGELSRAEAWGAPLGIRCTSPAHDAQVPAAAKAPASDGLKPSARA
jgi:hypothetical protein